MPLGKKQKKRRVSVSERAGLLLRVSSVLARARALGVASRVGKAAAVAAAAAGEYIAEELVALTEKVATDMRKQTATTQMLQRAISTDEDLVKVLPAHIHGGGFPNVLPPVPATKRRPTKRAAPKAKEKKVPKKTTMKRKTAKK